jgi:hypothetical protein
VRHNQPITWRSDLSGRIDDVEPQEQWRARGRSLPASVDSNSQDPKVISRHADTVELRSVDVEHPQRGH